MALEWSGREIVRPWSVRCDAVIVGSGPAGSAAADILSRAGLDVVVLEAGPVVQTGDVAPDAFTAMARHYVAMGAQMSFGRSPMPIVQGRGVGGTALINGAISWRLPEDVVRAWIIADPGTEGTWDPELLARAHEEVERRWSVTPTDPAIAGENSRLLAVGAVALGLEHRPTSRNVLDCEGLARCLQGCPRGHKQTPDRTFLADALAHRARLAADVHVDRVVVSGGRARGVAGSTAGGARFEVQAAQVLLAASAISTPLLLLRSGLTGGPVGRHLQGHPGAGVMARFADPVVCWRGATQGHEVIGLRQERLKFESLGLDRGTLLSRMPEIGGALAVERERLDRYSSWGVALRARTQGSVGAMPWGPLLRFHLGPDDLRDLRRGIATLGRLALAAGAVEVLPGVHGFPSRVSDPRILDALERDGPTDPRCFSVVMTHLFGTARLSSDPSKGVVGRDFQHHHVPGLFVVDSSVFPSNTGVNPMTSIAAVARLAARAVVRAA